MKPSKHNLTKVGSSAAADASVGARARRGRPPQRRAVPDLRPRQAVTDPRCPDDQIAGVVVTRAQIARRIGVLARHIAAEYARRELTILAVLTGSLVFLSDLIRRMPLRMRLNLVSVSSYPGQATTSQGPVFVLPEMDLSGKDVLVLDDILDSGQTLSGIVRAVKGLHPASVRTCVLVRKDRPDVDGRIEPDFWGFDVNNEFLVGYGLDFDNLYRNLPDLCVLRHGGDGEARP